jgi:nicotinate-nucleotide adenylyltransferase
MVKGAIVDHPAFELSRVDLDRPAPHYTVDTLKLLRKQFPASELFFIMGKDSLRDLPKWRQPKQIIARAWLAVAKRPGVRVNWVVLESAIPQIKQRIRWLTAPPIEIASSEIQLRVRQGRPVRAMLQPAVYEIAQREGLYKES